MLNCIYEEVSLTILFLHFSQYSWIFIFTSYEMPALSSALKNLQVIRYKNYTALSPLDTS